MRGGAYWVTTTVIMVMVGGEGCNNLDAVLLCGSGDLGDVPGIDGCGFVGGWVDEEVGVVVVADGNREDLHVARKRGSKGTREGGEMSKAGRETGTEAGKDSKHQGEVS